MSDPPGMLVAAIGTVDGIEFTLSNETDQDITVSLFVTPVTSECVNVFAPQLTVAPISFSTDGPTAHIACSTSMLRRQACTPRLSNRSPDLPTRWGPTLSLPLGAA